jgi:UDP-2-acetamido-3-amino-2,3-dideoxy-glucuronate N-acetyltransferase
MNRKLQIAVVGCGYWGKNHIRNFHQLGYLAGICDNDDNISQKMHKEFQVPIYSWEEILVHKDIHAVVLVTPSSTHCDLIIQALECGKHVFVEKPMTLTVSESNRVYECAKKSNRLVMVGHILRYHPAFGMIKKLFSEDKLGKIDYVYSCRFNQLTHDPRLMNLNVVWEFAPHDLSLLLGLFGTDGLSLQSTKNLNLGIKHMSFEYESNIKVEIDVSWDYPHKEQKFILSGDKQLLVFDDCQSWDKKVQLYSAVPGWTKKDPLPDLSQVTYVPINSHEPLRQECTHFVDCIINNKVPDTGAHEGRVVVSLIAQILESLAKNKENQEA